MKSLTPIVLGVAAIVRPAADAAAPGVGAAAPACELRSLRDERAIRLDDFRGSVTLVDFWASWCASCAESFPFLDAIDREFTGEGLKVLGISVDEDPADAKAFLAKHAAGFALALDERGECPEHFVVQGMPSSFLIDRGGRIREVFLGFRPGDSDRVRLQVRKLLSEVSAAQ
jgi:peroxiredoxin